MHIHTHININLIFYSYSIRSILYGVLLLILHILPIHPIPTHHFAENRISLHRKSIANPSVHINYWHAIYVYVGGLFLGACDIPAHGDPIDAQKYKNTPYPLATACANLRGFGDLRGLAKLLGNFIRVAFGILAAVSREERGKLLKPCMR